ncbi:MAG TPA: glycine cleavage system aminomethyltransferase GcvT [Roseiflexaceae bacterium]|nr:glycine cleavage system aminomethyltransferase GcvT [Roseiflexaceae bacterium]
MMTQPPEWQRTPLYARHVALGARMVEFGGWEMPVQYRGILHEHQAVRSAAGLFDISHMGEFEVSGRDALAFLQLVMTQDIAAIGVGQSNYALLCRADGGIVDDTFVYHLPGRYLVVVNAANIAGDFAWMQQHSAGFDVTLTDVSATMGMLALQGPQAEAILGEIGGDAALPFHGVAEAHVFGDLPVLIARTGYTGEDGFEIFCATAELERLWDGLLAAGATAGLQPCGLGARDSLRFEACLALYGHEITTATDPYMARLGWVVKLGKGEFIGRAALQQIKAAGASRRLVGFEMIERGIARAEYEIRQVGGAAIGVVTSGMPSPTLGKNLGMGYVPLEFSSEGSEFDVIVRERPVRARVVKMPFYKPKYKK